MTNKYLARMLLGTIISLTGGLYQSNLSKEYNPDIRVKQNFERMVVEKDDIFNQKIKEQSSDEINAPQYNTPKEYCSRYARVAAENLFGKKYSWDDAWNLRYKDKIEHYFREEDSFKELITNNILRQGMLVGIKQPDNKTSHENDKDLEGNKVKYTHIILYAGLNDNGEAEFLHQYGRKKEKISEKDFEKYGFTPKEIIAPKEDNEYLAQVKESINKFSKKIN